MKKAIITGIYGQDGSYLCEQLSNDGYHVVGVVREKLSEQSQKNKKELLELGLSPKEYYVDLEDKKQVCEFICQQEPDELYHMAVNHVGSAGKDHVENEFLKNIVITANILEACRLYSPKTRIVLASSCLIFDNSITCIQDENTSRDSHSLYGMAKITNDMLARYYRENGLHVSVAILYNHESHRRSSQFVTKKIVENMVRIKKREIDTFSLGNLEVKKDWGYAGDYTRAMQLMARAEIADDYILATGQLHTIREFVEKCAQYLEIENWRERIQLDSNIINRNVSGTLCGDSNKIQKELNWKTKFSFDDLVEEMIVYEMQYRS